MKCDYCSKEESLPFVCNYCGGTFCSEHRLPEAHQCIGDLSRRPVIIPSGTTSSWQGATSGGTRQRRPGIFSKLEVRDIILAWIALSAAFLVADRGRLIQAPLVVNLAVSLVTVGSGFVLHELMHKFTAQKYGYWAEFRMWPFGIVFALLTSVIGVIFAAPGATYVVGYDVPPKENGIISVAGPLTNVVVGAIFLPFLLVGNVVIQQAGFIGLSVNLFLAAFNMLPVMPLDGAKVFRWNKIIWLGIFGPLAIMVGALFLGIV